jgi:acid stress chaperone HdeB
MKIFTIPTLAAVAAICAATPALAAEAVDVSELSCKQFTGYDDDNKGLIMMWFEGYYTEEDEPATIDFGKMAGHLAQILIECDANPDKSVLEVSEDAMDD